jgi:hypothetical protein
MASAHGGGGLSLAGSEIRNALAVIKKELPRHPCEMQGRKSRKSIKACEAQAAGFIAFVEAACTFSNTC